MFSHFFWSRITLFLLGFISFPIAPKVDGSELGPVNTSDALSRVLQTAEAGDTILIANGRYDGWSVVLDCEGSEQLPVTVRPQNSNGVAFTGKTRFRVSGRHTRLVGFLFDHCDLSVSPVEFDRSENCRIEDSTFQHCGGEKAVVTIRPGARNNRVTGCRFIGIAGRSVQIRINEDITAYGIPTGNIIRNNLFQDTPPLGGNGRETIQIGQNQPIYGHIRAQTIVEANTFLRSNGEGEIISNKCSENSYLRNVFLDCDGQLVMRGGGYCLIEGNRLIGCNGGIRLSGTNHTVRDNVVVKSRGTGIDLFYGMTADQGGHYQAASQCLIANNTIVDAAEAGILIGGGRNKNWKDKGIQNVAPAENQILNNTLSGSTGDLLIVDHAPNNTIEGNLFHRQDSATISHPGNNPTISEPVR